MSGSALESLMSLALPPIPHIRQQARSRGVSVVEVLQTLVPDESRLSAHLAETAGILLWDGQGGAGRDLRPDFDRWSIELAKQTHAVLLADRDRGVVAAMADPWDESVLQRIADALGEWPVVAATTLAQLRSWIDQRSVDPVRDSTDVVPAQGPVVSFVDDALRQGFQSGASDVHFECDREGVTVKLRLDGVMVTHRRLDGARQAPEVISRIKVLASLDITERRVPQDGRFRLEVSGRSVDMRVSIMPSVHGEDAVLRLLDKSQWRGHAAVTLASLDFEPEAARQVGEISRLPSGMLLVTGPTGSGKTTTVYAALSEINTGLEKIITIEDPVEYELRGVLQIPVNERKGLTFAKGLRSILRHDPDRILVGEIRDAETAEIAIQSALTGHQVFTTVHANSIGDIVGRFRHFGLDMFGFMSALNGVVVQRLLRRLCEHCKQWGSPDAMDQRWLMQQGLDHQALPRATGCGLCRGTGYSGRFVLAEVHLVDDVLRDLIIGGAPLSALKQHAAAQGVRDLATLASQRVLAGQTSAAEVRRVIGWRP